MSESQRIKDNNTIPLMCIYKLPVVKESSFCRMGRMLSKQLDMEKADYDVMALVSLEVLPLYSSRCAALGCEHLCLLSPNGAVCRCNSRHHLMSDGRSCCPRGEVGETCAKSFDSPIRKLTSVSIHALYVSLSFVLVASCTLCCFFCPRTKSVSCL